MEGGGISAVQLLNKLNQLLTDKILKFSKKWAKRTKHDQSPWPEDGTFDLSVCGDLEVAIKNHKPKQKSEKRQKKREYELGVLKLFQNQGENLKKVTEEEHIRVQLEKRGKTPEEVNRSGEDCLKPPPYAPERLVRSLGVVGDYVIESEEPGGYPNVEELVQEMSECTLVPGKVKPGRPGQRACGCSEDVKRKLRQAEGLELRVSAGCDGSR
ncbi:hypothetical protein NQD34_015838 [Periophthalmus magnuspinnatus]|nr:hypothetical protein NQD34_015838 [Periophthalmus magnuspinnatus]